MNKKIKGWIRQALRKLSYRDPVRNIAKKRAYVSTGLYRCENCGLLCYSGTSEKNLIEHSLKYPEICTIETVRRGKKKFQGIELNHVNSVVPVDTTYEDMLLDTYCERMFPESPDAFSSICFLCHKFYSIDEDIQRGKSPDILDNFVDSLE